MRSFSNLDPAEAAPEQKRVSARSAAADRMLSRMRTGIPLGGPPYPKREEIYDRGSKDCSTAPAPGGGDSV